MIVGVATGCLLISGNVDLSIGGSFALTAVVTAAIAEGTGSAVAAVAAGLGAGIAIGLFNGTLIRLLSISPLIVTLGTALIFHGLAFVVTDGTAIFGFPDAFTDLGRDRFAGIPLPVWIALVFFGLVTLVLMRTVYGMRTFAIGGSSEAARRNGVSVERHVTGLFVLSGFAAALAGVLTTAQLGSGTANLGVGFELDVLTAVILGGVAFEGGAGRPVGIFTGIITIGILNAGMVFAGLEDFYQQIAKGMVLLLALGFDQYAAHRRLARRIAISEPAASTSGRTGRVSMGRVHRSGALEPSAFEPVFRAEGLSKRYGVEWANSDVGFSVSAGEVVCLLGDNGAGKSTLIKMMMGVQRPDDGAMWMNGQTYRPTSARQARERGVAAVFQDLALCPNLGAAFNLVLGNEPRRGRLGPFSLLDNAECSRVAADRLDRLGVSLLDYFSPVEDLSGGQKQSVAIARVAADDVGLVILDEPTAALGVAQTRNVLELTRALADRGAAVVMISHDVENVLAVADRVVVLHLGRVLFQGSIDGVEQGTLVHLMAGIKDNDMGTDAERGTELSSRRRRESEGSVTRPGGEANSLRGKVAVVAGAGGALGSAITDLLLREGGVVVACDSSEAAVDELSRRLKGDAGAAMQCDVTSAEQAAGVMATALERFGHIDVLVNNAGVSGVVAVLEMTEEQWDRVMDVNAKGVFLMSRAVLPAMLDRGEGTIINVASQAGRRGEPFTAHYCAAKAAVINFGRALALEVAPHVRVNTVCPGYVDSAMTRAGRDAYAARVGVSPEDLATRRLAGIPMAAFQTPDDIARVIAFLASAGSRHITGATIDVNGGETMH